MGLAEAFQLAFKALNGQIVTEQAFQSGDIDFKAQLTAVRALKPDGIFIPGYYTEVGLLARQIREMKISSTLIGGDGWSNPKVFELADSAVQGAYLAAQFSLDNPNPATKKFADAYKAKYGGEAPNLAAAGYDATRLLLQAMERAPDLSGKSIRDQLAATRNYDGVTGQISIDTNRNAVKPVSIVKIVGRKFEFVRSIRD